MEMQGSAKGISCVNLTAQPRHRDGLTTIGGVDGDGVVRAA